jgi:hypothetical protein
MLVTSRILMAGALTLVLLAGCGSRQSTHPASAETAAGQQRTAIGTTDRSTAGATTAPSAPTLVFFKRVFGTDPMATQLTVYTSGQGTAELGFGGVNGVQAHTFRLRPKQLHRLSYLLSHTPLQTTGTPDMRHYVYWVTTRTASNRLQDGMVPLASRPLIAELNAMADAHTGW